MFCCKQISLCQFMKKKMVKAFYIYGQISLQACSFKHQFTVFYIIQLVGADFLYRDCQESQLTICSHDQEMIVTGLLQ